MTTESMTEEEEARESILVLWWTTHGAEARLQEYLITCREIRHLREENESARELLENAALCFEDDGRDAYAAQIRAFLDEENRNG